MKFLIISFILGVGGIIGIVIKKIPVLSSLPQKENVFSQESFREKVKKKWLKKRNKFSLRLNLKGLNFPKRLRKIKKKKEEIKFSEDYWQKIKEE